MFQIKICGLTHPHDIPALLEAGVDAVGFNFHAESKRYISPGEAKKLAAMLPRDVLRVGLFVDAAPATVRQVQDYVALDAIQFHGNEPPVYLAQFQEFAILRALRLGGDGLPPVYHYLDQCREFQAMPRMVLLDAAVPGQYGGTGQLIDWTVAARYASDSRYPPLALAGGLTPDNVAQAIATVHPRAVDTASGVESSPGRKDPVLVKRFVAAAREAFADKS